MTIFTLASSAMGQDLFLISKKQNARSKDYKYQAGDKLVIGHQGKKKVGVFFVDSDTSIRFNDSLIMVDDIDWVMVKRGWAERVAQMGLKWGATYFFTFTINDWYRTGDPFYTRYTARNSLILIGIGAAALAVSLKKCKRENYHYFLIR